MDSVRFGRQIRALRRRKRWRQADVAAAANVSRSVVARIEQGLGDRVSVATLELVAKPLGARVTTRLDWNGEALDRLVDADHAAIVEQVIRILGTEGWLHATEVSFSIYGERGSIDILAFHPVERIVLVIEVKSVIPDVQATLVTLDRKARLAAQIARDRGWDARAVARLLVVRESRTARRRVGQHEATFQAALPARTWEVRRWLQEPRAGVPFSGLLFLSPDRQAVARQHVARRARVPERDTKRRL